MLFYQQNIAGFSAPRHTREHKNNKTEHNLTIDYNYYLGELMYKVILDIATFLVLVIRTERLFHISVPR